ncbi:hypothetical protein [Methanospirillum lacunae]|uniref:hypothetical protein n=1 Tax=Methanospirillum lacunae TaxID=668570 RepID=UPI0015E8702B|nr:hypothetical protein [Methanospirillum lacunae]
MVVENLITKNIEVYGDPLMRKVYTNLMENAIRHGGAIAFIRFDISQDKNQINYFLY